MRTTTNIGILAHVDAGKTSLTERILYHAGVIPTIGEVDHGTAQTDTMELERQRGISIQSAVTSFHIDEQKFNLIDTPGHSDFIAEVERALHVLDGVILVISAVEGIQPQTRRLARVIRQMGVPCMVVVNKIDRAGARADGLLDDIPAQLGVDTLQLNTPHDLGTRKAQTDYMDWRDAGNLERAVDVLSRHDPALLDAWVEHDGELDERHIRVSLHAAVRSGAVWPAIYASAITGAGIGDLFAAMRTFMPPVDADPDAPARAGVFKIVRTPAGERLVIARVFSGTIAVRQRIDVVRPDEDLNAPVDQKVTGIDCFRDGRTEPVQAIGAGEIARFHGLSSAKIGDWLGGSIHDRVPTFEPPVFESRIDVVDSGKRVAFNAALADLEDQDPFIALRRDPGSGETFLRLFGEVQREVVDATLREDYGIDVSFGERTVLCVERLLGEGHAAEIFPDTNPPFYATVGFRISPMRGDRETWTFTPGKAKQGFFDAAEAGGRSVLEQGLYGWPIIDWDVVVTDLIYLVTSVPVDYRRLAMLVMADAIKAAGTVVCEPVHEVSVHAPLEAVGDVIHALSVHRGTIDDTSLAEDRAVVMGTVPAAEIDALSHELPGLTNGRADLDTRFKEYIPVVGDPPIRTRTDLNPFDRSEFMSRLSGRF